MASIGNINCTFVRGHCPQPKMRVQLWTTPGVDGYGAQAMGYSDSPFEVAAVLYSNASGIAIWKAAIEALQGQMVTITNDLGVPRTRCLIVDISPMQSIPARAPGGITQRAEFRIRGVVT